MKLSLEQYDIHYEITTPEDDQNISQMFEFFESLLLAAGYNKENIKNYYQEWTVE